MTLADPFILLPFAAIVVANRSQERQIAIRNQNSCLAVLYRLVYFSKYKRKTERKREREARHVRYQSVDCPTMSSGGRRRRRLSVTVSHLYFHIKFSFYNEPWKKIELISFLFFLHLVWIGRIQQGHTPDKVTIDPCPMESNWVFREYDWNWHRLSVVSCFRWRKLSSVACVQEAPPLSHLHRDRLIVRGKNAPSNTSFDVDLVTWQALFLSIASLYATACRACSTLNEMKDLQLRRESVCRAGGGGFKVKNS